VKCSALSDQDSFLSIGDTKLSFLRPSRPRGRNLRGGGQGGCKQHPEGKCPGPDDFIRAFYHKYWDIVKNNVIAAVLQLSQLRGGTFKLLNSANIVLLPKKEEEMWIGDFRPISLVHSIAKKFSKILTNRLAPKLSEMMSSSQSAFVKRRCIQDNLLLVQGLLKEFHWKKASTLFIKLDIAKAFDSSHGPTC
jgi:hypothetical protein